MTISLTHKFQSAKSDGSDDTIVQPSDWNDTHDLTMAASRLFGRAAGTAGAAQENTLGDGLSFTSTTLNVDVIGKSAVDTAGATIKTTPADADSLLLSDSAATNGPKKLTWANLKAGLATLFNGKFDKTGGAITGNISISSTGPSISMIDTDGGTTRQIHYNTNLIGFLNNANGWSMYVDNAGNIYSGAYGWLHSYFAAAGAQCVHNTGVVEYGGYDTGITNSVGECPSPYVMIGLRRGTVGANAVSYIRCVALRNR